MPVNEECDLVAIFIFYKIATGVQAGLAFSDEFKHCNTITYDGSDWIMLDFDRTGILTRKIKCNDPNGLIRNLRVIKDVTAVITVIIKKRHKTKWKPFIVRSCNEICRYTAGINIGFTFNPVHLYKKLLKYRHTRNYEVLDAWRRKHGIFRGRQRQRRWSESGRPVSQRTAVNEQGGTGSQEAESISDQT